MREIKVVGAVLYWKNKILAVQRGFNENTEVSFRYEFPGGKIEPGEAANGAIMRELKEELDIDSDVKAQDYFMTTTYQYPTFHLIMDVFKVNMKSDYFQLKEHVDSKWLAVEELDTVTWAPADVPVVEKLMKSLNEQADA